jgi:hypothetical protein
MAQNILLGGFHVILNVHFTAELILYHGVTGLQKTCKCLLLPPYPYATFRPRQTRADDRWGPDLYFPAPYRFSTLDGALDGRFSALWKSMCLPAFP